MPNTPSTAAYAIDARGLVAWVDDGFAALAAHHGRPELARAVVGRPLVDHVAGERPRALQRALIDRARRSRAPLELRYRCDSPAERRHALLRLTAKPDGAILFETWFESVEPRPPEPLIDYALPRDERVAWLCSWCNRVDARGWRELEDAPARLRTAARALPGVQHSVCETCELLLTSGLGGR